MSLFYLYFQSKFKKFLTIEYFINIFTSLFSKTSPENAGFYISMYRINYNKKTKLIIASRYIRSACMTKQHVLKIGSG
jgi:hypothetical protein